MPLQSTTERLTHTAGPWTVTIIAIPDRGDVAYIKADTGHQEIAVLYNDQDQRGNARLIAAAPDLLQACRYARAILPPEGPTYAQVNAAIAKAEGR